MIHFLKLAVLAIALLIQTPSFAAKKAPDYSKKQVLADINQMVGLLKKNHPNLYAHRNSKEFQAIVQNVKNRLPAKMSRLDAVIRFQQILAAVCDEHTGVVFSPKNEMPEFKKANFLEASLISREDRIIVGNNSKRTNSEVILSIGEHKSEDINAFMQSLQSQDGCLEHKSHVIDGTSFQGMLFLGNFLYQGKPTIPVKLRDNSGKFIKRNKYFIKFIGASGSLGFAYSMKSVLSNIILTRKGFVYQGGSFHKDYLNPEIRSYPFFNKSRNMYYLKVDSFLGGKKLDKQIDKRLRKLISDKPDHVIIDLTDNPGGRILSAGRFLSYFLPRAHRPARYVRAKNRTRKIRGPFIWRSAVRKKAHLRSMRQFRRVKRRRGQYRLPYRSKSFGNPDYKGPVSVLVGPRTHSAATMVAAILKVKRDAKIIGFVNKRNITTACYAPPGSFRLKNTRVIVDIPFSCYDRDKKTYGNLGSLKPDVVVNPMVSSTSYLGLRTIEAALKELAKPKIE